MLAGDARSSRILYHGLQHHVDVSRVVLEEPVPASERIRSRLRRQGVLRTAGQLLFLLANRILSRRSHTRIAILVERYGLDDRPIPPEVVTRVTTVNCSAVARIIHDAAPDAVVVNGTRIISREILSSARVPFLNGHMGITPRYRGVHGAYWALASGDEAHCGVTVHLVDEGIDTGGVLYQDTIAVDPEDDVNTYPIHQIARILPLMRTSLDDVLRGTVRVKAGIGPSRLWFHPTLYTYVKHRWMAGVR